ncbi:MAG: phage major capsid protein [Chloroflexi bacterium]|nr:phage major capsid protein [Chloroflexota bacterium]
MPFNSLISRNDAAALIPEDVSREILKNMEQTSAVMRLARRLPDMPRAQRRLPVLSALASAYFVAGDTGLKQTSEITWENKYVDAEELAVIVPIPEAVLDDADYDIWGEVRPQVEEALGLAIDQAVLYGTNIPASWSTNLGAAGLVAVANGAGHVASAANYTDLYEALLGETQAGADGVLMLIEADGFMASGHVAHMSMRGMLRNCRSTEGAPIFTRAMQDASRYELDGQPIYFPTNGAIDSAQSLLISGDWTQLVYAMRQDITYKVLDQAVIQDAGGNILYNLAQQDMVALRAVMRLGFALPNPINRMNQAAATRCPFAVLTA